MIKRFYIELLDKVHDCKVKDLTRTEDGWKILQNKENN